MLRTRTSRAGYTGNIKRKSPIKKRAQMITQMRSRLNKHELVREQLNRYSKRELEIMLFEIFGDDGILKMMKIFDAREPKTDAYSDAEMSAIIEANRLVPGPGFDEIVNNHKTKYPTVGYL